MVCFACLSMHSILVKVPYHKYLYEKVKIYYFKIIYIVLHLYLYIVYIHTSIYCIVYFILYAYKQVYIWCVCLIRITLFRGITHPRNHRLPNKKPSVCCVTPSFRLLVRSASENFKTTQVLLLVSHQKLMVFSVENITHIGHRTNGISLLAMDIEHFVR